MLPFLKQWRPRSRIVWHVLGALLVLACMAAALYIFCPPYYHLHAGEQALQHYDFDAAGRHFDLCLKSWPNSAETRLLAARTGRRRGDLADAEQHLAVYERLQGVTTASARERADEPRSLRTG